MRGGEEGTGERGRGEECEVEVPCSDTVMSSAGLWNLGNENKLSFFYSSFSYSHSPIPSLRASLS